MEPNEQVTALATIPLEIAGVKTSALSLTQENEPTPVGMVLAALGSQEGPLLQPRDLFPMIKSIKEGSFIAETGEDFGKELVGCLVHMGTTRTLWCSDEEQDALGDNKLLCLSVDGITGTPNNDVLTELNKDPVIDRRCTKCAYSQFVGKDRPPCRTNTELLFLPVGSEYPVLLSLSPMQSKSLRSPSFRKIGLFSRPLLKLTIKQVEKPDKKTVKYNVLEYAVVQTNVPPDLGKLITAFSRQYVTALAAFQQRWNSEGSISGFGNDEAVEEEGSFDE